MTRPMIPTRWRKRDHAWAATRLGMRLRVEVTTDGALSSVQAGRWARPVLVLRHAPAGRAWCEWMAARLAGQTPVAFPVMRWLPGDVVRERAA